MNKIRILGAALAAAALMAACDRGGDEPATVRLDSGDAKVLATGEKVYEKHCASCHGAQLQGQPNWRERDPSGRLPAPPHDASGHTWHHPDEVLFNITKYGVAKAANLKDYQSAMPVYEGVLSDAEIIAALSWIKSRWPAGVRDKQEQVNEAALKNKAALQR
jgi:S-disulfanyl-L-cysteine oxidoreductase SoxD